MNSARYDSGEKHGRGRWGPLWACAALPVVVWFAALVLHLPFACPCHPHRGGGPSGTADRVAFVFRHPPALDADLAGTPAPVALLGQGLFTMPADTEFSDSEPVDARSAKPVLLTLSWTAWAAWPADAARRVTVPLYLFHQALLC